MTGWFRPVQIAGSLFVSSVLIAGLLPARQTLARGSLTRAPDSSHSCVVLAGAADSPFQRNFNPYAGSQMDFTFGAIYEPLVVDETTLQSGRHYNWLSTKQWWSNGNKTYNIAVRKGVNWSDGTAMTAADVVYSLEAGKTMAAAFDKIQLLGKSTNIAGITAQGWTVQVHLKKPDSTFPGNLDNVWIVPRHIWVHVKDPTKFADPNPVATGPFTQIVRFTSQLYEIGKNPHYWQKGKPYVSCLQRVYEASNDTAMLAMSRGDVDWTGNFVPKIQQVYVSRDPKDYHYWYNTAQPPIGFFFNDQQYPYSLPAFRKGISLAIDREQLYKVGEYGYAPPSTALGIWHQYPSWVDPALMAQNKAMVAYNPAKARQILQAAGFTWKNGLLIDPHGHAVSFTTSVPSGYTDWVSSIHIIADNLKAIGINANVQLASSYGTWYAGADKAQFPTMLWTYGGGISPYSFFYSVMDKKSYTPPNVSADPTGDWMHWYSPEATALLNQWQATVSVARQKQIAYKLERIFLQQFPFVPLFIGPVWYTYSTKYFVGWPNSTDQYADGAAYDANPSVPVYTHIRPK